jgi:fibro-slime domain-containing protein/RHS repeat-associated protein
MRRFSTSWTKTLTKLGFRHKLKRSYSRSAFDRRPLIEFLEPRHLLTAVTVANNLDVVNGNVTSISNLIAAPGADGISLREALLAAHATAGADTITFAPSMAHATISLTYDGDDNGAVPDQFLIDSNVTIDGGGLDLTIDGDGENRLFYVNSGVTATIRGLTIEGGGGVSDGGGIYVAGNLTLDSVQMKGNSASQSGGAVSVVGGASGDGTLHALNSVFEGNHSSDYGGAIFVRTFDIGAAFSTLTLEKTRIVGNTAAGYGGGIYTFGNFVTVQDSEVSDNTAGGAGGGIYVRRYSADDTFSIANSTISGNKLTISTSQGGGLYSYVRNEYGPNPIQILNTTISDNRAADGGGVFITESQAPLPLVKNSIIAGNKDLASASADDVSGTSLDPNSSYNLIGSGGSGGLTHNPNAGNHNYILGSPGAATSAGLAPLDFYGGPTKTHALLPGSVAIDAGEDSLVPAGIQYDQRGEDFNRINRGHVDIGAFEYSQTIWREAENYTDLVAPTLTDPVNNPVLQVIGDLTASGSRLISEFTNGDVTGPSNPVTNFASYEFTVDETGTFYVWGRVKAPSTHANSFYIKMDNGPWLAWNNITTDPNWQWRQVPNGSSAGFNITTAGTHTFYVATNKDATQLDKLLITDRVDLTPTGVGGTDPAMAALREIDLTATVRDFHSSSWLTNANSTTLPHPDFEGIPSNQQQQIDNLVTNRLVDGKPVFNMNGSPAQLHGATNFNLWWEDDPGYNRTVDVSMHLLQDPSRPDIFQFVGSVSPNDKTSSTHEFYPVDDLGFSEDHNSPEYEPMVSDENDTNFKADEVQENHNYGFTTELHSEFTYEPGQYLNIVQADDDLWVFVNGQKVVDLGGVHGAQREESGLIDNLLDDPDNSARGHLIPGKTYSFDLFYAERHTFSSHLVFETNIEDLHQVAPSFTITEGTRLLTTDEDPTANGAPTTFVVAQNPQALRIPFSNLHFDSTAGNPADVNDAFELTVLNSNGKSALATIDPNSDALFNITQGESPRWAKGVELLTSDGQLVTDPGTSITDGMVQIDISSLMPGTVIQLGARLVNNDSDNTTSVAVSLNDSMQGLHSMVGDGAARLLPIPVNRTDRILPVIDFGKLHDVSSAFRISYQETTFDAPNDPNNVADLATLETRLALAKIASALQVRGDLLLAIKPAVNQVTGIIDNTQLLKIDGRLPIAVGDLPAGTPFVRLSNLLSSSNGFYQNGTLNEVELAFSHAGNQRFDFDAVVLGELNDPPSFTSDPYSMTRGQAYPINYFPTPQGSPVKELEIVAQNGATFSYKPTTQDPNGDWVKVQMVGGPSNAAVALDVNGYGGTLTWQPAAADANTVVEFVLRAVDEFGAFDPANDQVIKLHVLGSSANRPPRFTTPPVTTVNYGSQYSYDADAFDPDPGDTLTFSGTLGAHPVQYQIPIGQLITTGNLNMNYLTFINQANGAAGTGTYSNIRLYEDNVVGDPETLKFNQSNFGNFGSAGGDIQVLDDGSVVRLTGNGSKQIRLDSTYALTSHTVLAFTFASDSQGVTEGIGLDSQTTSISNGRWIQLYGTGTGGATQTYHTYSPTWLETPDFHVVPGTGVVTWTPPADVIGQWVHVNLTVTDSHGASDQQPYEVLVKADPANRPPLITSKPVTTLELPGVVGPPSSNVSVDGTTDNRIDLSLGLEDSSHQTVHVTIPDSPFGQGFEPPQFFDNGDQVTDLTVRGRGDQSITDYMSQQNYPDYETALLNILTGGSTYGLSNVSVNLSDQMGGVHGTLFNPSNTVDPNASSTGIFVDPSGTYNLFDYGVVLSTGDVRDYGEGLNTIGGRGTFQGNTTAFGDNVDANNDQKPDGIPARTDRPDPNTPSQEELLDQVTDGTANIHFTIDDGANHTSLHSIALENGSPFSSIATGPAYENVEWTYDVNDSGEGSTVDHYRLDVQPPHGVTFDTTTGELTWTPQTGDAGKTFRFVVAAVGDFGGGVAEHTQSFEIPVLAGSPQSQTITSVVKQLIPGGVIWNVSFAEDLPTNAILTLDDAAIARGLTITQTGANTVQLEWDNAPQTAHDFSHFDATQLDINFNAGNISSISFDLVFGSEEFPDYKGQAFVDGFGLFFNGQNLASVNGLPININHPNMVAPAEVSTLSGSTELNGILVNDPAADPLNPVIRVTIPVTPNSQNNHLTFVIADTDDAVLDSTVYISAISTTSLNNVDVKLQADPSDAVLTNVTPASYHNVERGSTVDFDFDLAGDGAAHAFNLNFVDPNTQELFGSIPVTINVDYFYLVTAQDPDNDPLTYSLEVAPQGATIDSHSGRIQWDSPSSEGNIAYAFKVRVDDGRGGFDEQSFNVTVGPNFVDSYDPVITPIDNQTARVGRPFSYDIVAHDQDDVQLHYYLTTKPAWMSIDSSGRITGTPPSVASDVPVVVTVLDGHGRSATESFTVTVLPDQIAVNSKPVITSNPPSKTTLVDDVFEYDVKARDDDHDPYTFDLPVKPKGMTIDPVTGVLAWKPTFDQAGHHTLMVRVQDNHGGLSTQTFDLEVINPNDAPVIDPKPFNGADQNVDWTYQVSASDANGDTLYYDVKMLTPLQPGEAAPTIDNTFTGNRGKITWHTPMRDDVFNMLVTVSDKRGGTAQITLSVPVNHTNLPPQFDFVASGPAAPVVLNEPWSYTFVATDDHDSPSQLRFSVDQAALQRNIHINAQTGELTWTPDTDAPATILVTVTDHEGASSQAQLTLPVNVRTTPPGQNAPPSIDSKTDSAATVGRQWSYTVKASDLDGQTITLSAQIDGSTSGVTFVPISSGPGKVSKTLHWTPPAGFAGPAHVVITADDGHGGTATQTIDLPVIENSAPIIVSALASSPAKKGTFAPYLFKVVDFDSDDLRLELLSPAPGTGYFSSDEAGLNHITQLTAVSADPQNPTLFYLQLNPDQAGQQDVSIRVTDANGKHDEHTIHLDITDPNNHPPAVRLEVPTTVFLGDTLDIRVQGDNPDQDGDRLQYFFVDEKGNRISQVTDRTAGGGLVPAGMSIDENSGRIAWTPMPEQLTPGSNDAYTFSVQVTDGHFVVTLGPAELRVIPQPVHGPTNTPPFIVRAPASARIPAGQPITFTFGFIDVDGGTIDLSDNTSLGSFATTHISNVSTNPDNPTLVDFTFTAPSTPGATSFTISVTDGASTSVTFDVPLDVYAANSNALPSGSLKARDLAAANEEFVAQATGDDPERKSPVYSLIVDTTGGPQLITHYSPDAGGVSSMGSGLTPVGMQIDPATGKITWTPTSDQVSNLKYSYAVAIDDDANPTNGYTTIGPVDVQVVDRFSNSPPRIVSSPQGLTAAGGKPLPYQAIGEDDDHDPLTWKLVSGPSTAHIDENGLFIWNPGPDEANKTETAIIQVSDPYGPGQQQGITLSSTVSYTPGNTAPRITSTPPQPGNVGEVYPYLVRAIDDEGQPISFKVEGVAPTTLSGTNFTNNGDGTATFTWVSTSGTSSFKFTATDSQGLSSSQTITVTPGNGTNAGRADTPPTIDNRAPLAVAVGDVYYHHVQVTDPDASAAAPIAYAIVATRANGQAVTTLQSAIDSNGVINWTPAAGDVGNIDVTIKASQNGATATQSFTLQVLQPNGNGKPVLGSPIDLFAAPGQHFAFSVPGTDPENGPLEFFLVDSTGSLTREIDGLQIDRDGNVTWQVPTDVAVGQHRSFTVQLKDNLGQLSTGPKTYTITIRDDQAPSIALDVSTRTPLAGSEVGFALVATDDIGISDLRLTVNGQPVAVNADGHAIYTIPSGALQGTSYSVVATAVDTGNHTTTTSVQLVVRGGDISAPIISIASPNDGSVLKESTDLMGRIYDVDNELVFYSITATPFDGGAPITLATNSGTFLTNLGESGAVKLATINALALKRGAYEIDIVARDVDGNETTASTTVDVASDVQLGDFSLSYTDLNVSIGGVPVTVKRTYDALASGTKGDFGYGWSLDVITGKMQYRPAGDIDNDFNKFLGYEPAITGGSRITFTLPNGEVQGFTVVPVPVDQGAAFGVDGIQGLFGEFTMAFQPDPGQGSSLEMIGSDRPSQYELEHFYYPGDYEGTMPDFLYFPGFDSVRGHYDEGTGEFTSISSDGMPLNFTTIGANLRLHTRDGAEYDFNPKTGELIESKDAYGNTVDFTGTDIISSDSNHQETGRLTIRRDDPAHSGLITSISDANGHTVRYTYDSDDNLVGYYDRAAVATGATSPTTTFGYGDALLSDVPVPIHYLTSVKNALGVTTLQIGFDSTGQLKTIKDASGQSGNFSYPSTSGGVIEKATDANGVSTEVVRDGRGNVERRIQQTKRTGDANTNEYLVTLYVYDDLDRETLRSVPIRIVGDAARLIVDLETDPTSMTFDASQWQSQTTYDDKGHVLSTIDGAGQLTLYGDFDDAGHPGTITDALGNVTTNVYVNGQLMSTIDAAGGQTNYHYDIGGQLDSMTQVGDDNQSNSAVFGYTLGRLTQATGSDGQSHFFAYDKSGNQSLSYSYNSLANQTIVTRTDFDADDRVTGTRQYTVSGQHSYDDATALDGVTADWSTTTHYDAASQVDYTIDRYGTYTYETYDVRDNVVETRTASKDQSGTDVWVITRTLYDENGRSYFTTDPYSVPQAGYIDTNTPADVYGTYTQFDDSGRDIRTARCSGVVVQLTNAGGLVRNSFSTFDFDSASAVSESKTYYDAQGRVQFTVDDSGLITKFEYDEAGREQYVTQYLTGTLNDTGDPATRAVNPATIANPATDVLLMQTFYDDAGRVDHTIDPRTVTTQFGYDGVGRVTSTVADTGTGGLHVTTYTHYDTLGRKDYEIDGLGNRTDYEYDNAGRLTAVVLPEVDNSTGVGPARVRPRYEYAYDAYGNQTLIRDPMDDKFGIGTTDKETHFTYDAYGRELTHTLPDGLSESFTYDAKGQQKLYIDFEGRYTAFDYDQFGRLISKKYYASASVYNNGAGTPGQTIVYTYDTFGRLVSTNDSAFTTSTAQTYDDQGRLTQIDSPQGTINYEYDAIGRLTRTYTGLADPTRTSANGDGKAITDTRYSYDRLNRLKTVQVVERNDTRISENPTLYIYDKDGNLDKVRTPNGVVADYDYDNLNQLTFLRNFKDNGDNVFQSGTDVALAEYTYTVNADGQRTHAIEKLDVNGDNTLDASDTTNIDWVYDELGRLTEERYDSYDNSLDDIEDYSFDLASNRTKLVKDDNNAVLANFNADETATYHYDVNDRLLDEATDVAVGTANDSNTVYAYSGTTQQTGKTYRTGSATVGSSTTKEVDAQTYNLQGQMASMTVDKTGAGDHITTYTYKYNDDGIRVIETNQVDGGATSTTVYHIDPNNPTGFAQIIEEGVEAAGTTDGQLQKAEITKSYALGLDVISQATAATTPQYLLYDGHGSTRALVSAAAAILERYAYDAYGNALAAASLTANPSTRLLYSGERTDQTGLQYLRGRYYDPHTGRFNRTDSFAGSPEDPTSLHRYLYAQGDPLQNVDPTGLLSSLFGTSEYGQAAHDAITPIYKSDHGNDDTSRSGRATKIGKRPEKGVLGSLYYAKVDLLDKTPPNLFYAEIKPLSPSGLLAGAAQLKLRAKQFEGTGYVPDDNWKPSTHVVATKFGDVFFFRLYAGLVVYSDADDLQEDLIVSLAGAYAAQAFAALEAATVAEALAPVEHFVGATVALEGTELEVGITIEYALAA